MPYETGPYEPRPYEPASAEPRSNGSRPVRTATDQEAADRRARRREAAVAKAIAMSEREEGIYAKPPKVARTRVARRRIPVFNTLLCLLAAAGVAFGVHVARTGAKPVPVAQPAVQPSRPPFRHYIAGAGIIESATENILISTPTPGMVMQIPVAIGQQVDAGDLLFEIDSRDLQAQLAVRRAAVDLARAKVPEAQSNVDDAQQMFESYKAVIGSGGVTKEEFNRRRFGLAGAQSRLQQALADVASTESQVAETQTEIARRRVTAPVAGQVLQLKVHVGEYAQVGPLATPLMVLGQTRTLHVRTDVDENDAWRFSPDARAIAYVRGNPALSTPLSFVHVEPFVVPKASLTGDPGERVDTRVLQVLFAFDPIRLHVYVGQQMDVYIDVPDPAATAPTTMMSRE